MSIGLEAYWPQFSGLRERFEQHNLAISRRLSNMGSEVANIGIVDSPEAGTAAGHELRRCDVDILFLHVATYALSSTVLPAVRRLKVPVIILNLVPETPIDYGFFNQLNDRTAMTGEWLGHCQSCAVPEIINVFRRCGILFNLVTGTLAESDEAWPLIAEWVAAAKVVFGMEHNRLGVLGHYYSGMLDIYSDLTAQSGVFGTHIEIVEVDELSALRRSVSPTRIKEKIDEIRLVFDIRDDCTEGELERAAQTAVALDDFVAMHNLGSLAYYYKGVGIDENMNVLSSIIVGTSLLTSRGIPVAGELEIKNVQAMKILDLFGVGGSFTEYYANDYLDDVVLMGHDGPGHIGIAEGLPKLRPLQVYHGKIGKGLSVEMSVKNGPVTLLSVTETGNGKLKLVFAEGEAVSGPVLQIGNTNSRYKFALGARGFQNAWNLEGTAHHWAIGPGHIASKLVKFAILLGIDYSQVC